MLLVERKATIPSEYVVKKINSFVNNFLDNLFKRFGGKGFKNLYKLDEDIINKYENWLDENEGYEYIGDIWARDLETNKNIKIKAFICSSKKMKDIGYGHANALYISKQILISVDYLKEDRREIISTIEHEIIHSIHKFKKLSSGYNPEKLYSDDPEESLEASFIYFTEEQEFDTILGELSLSIIELFESSDDNKKIKILDTLKGLLKRDKDYFKELDRLQEGSIINELFFRRRYLEFIYSITHPPVLDLSKYDISDTVLQNLSNEKRVEIVSKRREIKYKNEKYQKVSNNRYLQFKQKLFNTYQKLVNDYKKIMKQR